MLTVSLDALQPLMALSALCGVVLAGLSGVVAMPSLVVLASRLTGYAEAMGYIWPADAQLDRMLDEHR
jgi:hypothetical protein